MKKILLAIALLSPLPAMAQTILPNPSNDETRAPRPARARGITSALAVELAQVANANCLAKGHKTTTIVIDSEGVPLAMVSNDGAAAITQRIAMGKAMISLKTKGTTADAAKAADPAILATYGVSRAGGIPIMAGADIVGAAATSGAPGGDIDASCVTPALAALQARIK